MIRLLTFLVLLLVSPPVFAQTINNLGAATTPLAGTEQVPLFQGSNPAKQTTAQAIANLAVTGVFGACAISVGASEITSIGTVTLSFPTTTVTAGTYTIGTSNECGGLTDNTGASGSGAFTLPQAGTGNFVAGWFETYHAVAQPITITPTTSTIGGASSLSIPTGTGVTVISDGTNYRINQNPTVSSGTVTSVTVTAGAGISVSGTCPTAITSSGTCQISNTVLTPSSYRSGVIYTPQGVTYNNGIGTAQTANTIYCFPGYVLSNVTINTLGAFLQTGSSGNNVQFAIYSLSGNTLTLVDNTASQSVTTGGQIVGGLNNTTDSLVSGTIYLWCSNSSGTPTFLTPGTGNSSVVSLLGTSTYTNALSGTPTYGLSIIRTFASGWPSSLTLSGMTGLTATHPVALLGFTVN